MGKEERGEGEKRRRGEGKRGAERKGKIKLSRQVADTQCGEGVRNVNWVIW
jgi:hypothetical protein